MDAFAALPEASWLDAPLVAFGLLVLVALVAGEGAARHLRVPRIVGYAATGMALGMLGIVPAPPTESMRLLTDLCLGVVLFELGATIDVGWLVRAPWIAALALFESIVAGVCLYLVLHLGFEVDAPIAAIGAAIGISTSPAVVLRVAREVGAQGQVTERMLMLSATNTAVAVLALSSLAPVLAPAGDASISVRIASAGLVLVGSGAVAALLAGLGLFAFRAIGKQRECQLIGSLGLISIGTGLAAALHLSSALVLLGLGIAARGLDRHRRMLAVDFGRIGELFYLVLFALVGASLDPRGLLGVAAAALAFVAVRAGAKAIAVLVFARPTRQPIRKAALLALTLQPMSGAALVLAQDALLGHAAVATLVLPAILAAVVVFELVGPPIVQLGLRLAGEADPASV